jgi:hypothetical protein
VINKIDDSNEAPAMVIIRQLRLDAVPGRFFFGRSLFAWLANNGVNEVNQTILALIQFRRRVIPSRIAP